MTRQEAHEYNLDAAYRAMEMREAQGEDMSGYYVDEKTYEIKRKDEDTMPERGTIFSLNNIALTDIV